MWSMNAINEDQARARRIEVDKDRLPADPAAQAELQTMVQENVKVNIAIINGTPQTVTPRSHSVSSGKFSSSQPAARNA